MRIIGKSGMFHSEDESIVELTLSLPGTTTSRTAKRGFADTVDLHLSNSSSSMAQMLGWPPVRANRKNAMMMRKSGCKYVKVAVDGAPYLRKVDLEMYDSYEELLAALETLFPSLTIRNHLNERKLMDIANGVEYLPTYEDKDADWMLVGDVPWEMFVESCKKIRLVIR